MEKEVLKYALENAVKYNGKANVGAVIGKIFSELKIKDKKKLVKTVQKVVKEVNNLSLDEQKKKLGHKLLKKKVKHELLPKLPNAKGKVVMRIAPYPSGALHIGNARTFILNDYYCKKHKGKLFLVIDDTIGSEEKQISKDAYKLIIDGLKWLGIKFNKIIYKSDRLKIYYKYAEELIKKGAAYICECDHTTLRYNRQQGIICDHREKTVKENLKDWKKMFKAKEGSVCLRLKTNMQDLNPAFRDRVLFRISDRKHPKVGKKYRVWPMLEFSWAIDDHLLGITHVLRGKELRMESEVEEFIWKIFKWKPVTFVYNGLMQISGVKISKSKSSKEVLTKKYIGWGDPRTWSLQSLEKRGIKPEAIRNFIYGLGLSETEITVNIDSLYHENKKIIDKSSDRYFFIENPEKIKIKNAPKLTAKLPLHPDIKRGYRILKTNENFLIQDKLKKNKNYRLMHLFNFKDNKFISENLDENLNAILIHWLPGKNNLNVEILMADGTTKRGIGEKTLEKVKVGEVIQFERQFFVRCDSKGKVFKFWFTHR